MLFCWKKTAREVADKTKPLRIPIVVVVLVYDGECRNRRTVEVLLEKNIQQVFSPKKALVPFEDGS